MQTKVLLLLFVATATAGIVAAAASASGPAPPGKDVAQVTCDGLGTITVSLQRGDGSNGAAQFVDAKGHGLGVDSTFQVIDLNTATVVATETRLSGHGNGHPNQPTTHCYGVLFQGPASDFFGADLPAGVEPTHTVQFTVDALAILAP